MSATPFFLLIDIDGLRYDVFQAALAEGRIPNLSQLLGQLPEGASINIPVSSTAPSITFCAQASIFTGSHPREHGIPGNQFFDRFGDTNQGRPRFYTFDVGDQLGYLDSIQVFTDGLAANLLQVETLYEKLAARGMVSVVAGNMYASGAEWVKPTLLDLARLTKMPRPLKLTPPDYDKKLLDETLAYLGKTGRPDLLTYYLKGLDSHSHQHGPEAQFDYLVEVIDPEIGNLWAGLVALDPGIEGNTVTLVFSDHGQIATIPDDQHSLRLAFPFEKEMAPLFEHLGLDVHDYPGEGPDCSAVVAMNGGLAYVYLRNKESGWEAVPNFERDVLPVGAAFWQAHTTGEIAPELDNALAAVLIRNVERDGWQGEYQALTSEGEIISLDTWFDDFHPGNALDPVQRLQYLRSGLTGDLILVSNYLDGFYFSPPLAGTHGGLHVEDSKAFLAACWPEGLGDAGEILAGIKGRCRVEGDRAPSLVDIPTLVLTLLD